MKYGISRAIYVWIIRKFHLPWVIDPCSSEPFEFRNYFENAGNLKDYNGFVDSPIFVAKTD